MLKKIISNGQSGAGTSALKIAKQFNYQTGGIAPHNWVTLLGNQQSKLQGYGLVADKYNNDKSPCLSSYTANCSICDGIIWYGITKSNQYNLIRSESRDKKIPFELNLGADRLVQFIEQNNIETLYVCGSNPTEFEGIDDFVEQVLSEALVKIREEK